jgi:hypothetical protein
MSAIHTLAEVVSLTLFVSTLLILSRPIAG